MTSPYPKRLIEVDLPIKRISAHARREKSIRHGHISTLHIWWARRPLAACRAVILCALWPDPADPNCPQRFRKEARERMLRWARDNAAKASTESFDRLVRIQKNERVLDDVVELRRCLLDFIADFANWDNSTDSAFLETSRALVQVAHEVLGGVPGTRPLVVDPFAGGGSIPLEALRVGADAFASDLNPVAVLLNKVILEYIPKYGQRLADEVRKWGAWVKKEAEEELAEFYPKDPGGATPIAYLWARTITCEGPGCGVRLPLIRSSTLTMKPPVAHLRIAPTPDRAISVSVRTGSERSSTATIRGGKATCPVCGFTTQERRVKGQLGQVRGGGNHAILLAVLVDSAEGRRFRPPSEGDGLVVRRARARFLELETDEPEAFPLERINPVRPYKNTVGVCIVTRMGIARFIDLYTYRQAVALRTIQALVGRAFPTPGGSDGADLAGAVRTTLHLALDRLVMQNSSLSRWNTARSTIEGLFSKQALQAVWDFAESNPIGSGMASWEGAVDWVAGVVAANLALPQSGKAELSAADRCPLPEDSVDLLFTDPPYFAAIVYADLSDVFYVWLRRSWLGRTPLFGSGPIVERAGELVVTNSALGPHGEVKDYAFFTSGMARALSHGRAMAKPAALACFVFADASTTAWEAMLSAVLQGGWCVTASWPMDTEMQGRTRARSAASLQSSVFLVCRPRENPDGSIRTDAIGDWRDVLATLPKRIREWMPRLAEEGVVGADAIFACLGPALEIFSRYSRVEKASGEQVTLKEYLEHVWAAVAQEALSMIFAGAETSGFEEDARLTAIWLWTLSTGGGIGKTATGRDETDDADDEEDEASGTKPKVSGFTIEYDAARKIAQGLGAHLEALTTLVEVKGETARLLPVAERTRALFGKDESEAPTARRKRKAQQMKLGFAQELEDAAETGGWGQKGAPRAGQTVLDRVHQSMILFAAGRAEALRRFLVDEGTGRDARFWRLAQALAALYPTGTDERRWVEGVLARKKGLGF